MRTMIIVLVAAGLALPAAAEVKLKQAPGVDKAEANCQARHSLAYIPMNSPFLKAAVWDVEVGKIIKVFGAPIADAKAIADYRKANYGG